jgi:hypothetical protein
MSLSKARLVEKVLGGDFGKVETASELPQWPIGKLGWANCVGSAKFKAEDDRKYCG